MRVHGTMINGEDRFYDVPHIDLLHLHVLCMAQISKHV